MADEDFEIEAILDYKETSRGTYYRVRWKGFGPDEDIYLPEEDLKHSDLLEKYLDKISRNKENLSASLGNDNTIHSIP